MIRKIQKFVSISLLTLGFGTAMADSLECPSAKDFQNHFLIPPYSYKHHKDEIKFSSISWNSDFSLKQQGQWVLVLKSIKATPKDNHEELVKGIIDELENVNANSYQLNSTNDESSLQYCLYNLPSNEQLSAIAYFIPVDKDIEFDKKDKLQKPVNRFIKAFALI